MDCDEIETEATKTIGSTDIEKVLKKLKNKNTKESIILLDYISKLQADIEIKDKVIDLMANLLCSIDVMSELGKESWNWNKEQMKEYFYKKV